MGGPTMMKQCGCQPAWIIESFPERDTGFYQFYGPCLVILQAYQACVLAQGFGPCRQYRLLALFCNGYLQGCSQPGACFHQVAKPFPIWSETCSQAQAQFDGGHFEASNALCGQ